MKRKKPIQDDLICKFTAHCDRFFASKEGRNACTSRYSLLVRVEKLRGETFARCVRQTMESTSNTNGTRIMIECKSLQLPVVCAKVVDTAIARIPYFFRRQRWSPFKKHENVLVLLAHNDIVSLDSAINLSDLGKTYEEAGLSPFDPSLPWVGVGIHEKSDDKDNFSLNLGYKVESSSFDAANSRIVVKASDKSFDLIFGLD